MIMFRTLFFSSILTFALAACEGESVNPPTEPAAPVSAADGSAPTPAPVASGGNPAMPGSGPATFVGHWAANPDWCANPRGDHQPITISPLRFEGYENSCAITSLDQVQDGYEASLACQAEGEASRERVRLSVQGDKLRLIWLNRNDALVLLTRCPAPTPVGAAKAD